MEFEYLILNIWSTLKNVVICKILILNFFCYNYFSFLGANGRDRQLQDEQQIAINLVPTTVPLHAGARRILQNYFMLYISLQKQHVCLTKNSVTSVAVQCHRIHQVTMPYLFVATEDAPQTFFSGEVVRNNLGVFIRQLEVALHVLVTEVALGPNAKPVADLSKKELRKV